MSESVADPTAAPVAPVPTEPCRSCGVPLAADQRYCLNCGTRAAEARVDVMRELAPAASATTVTTVTTAQRGPTLVDRAGGPAGIAAALLAALGVGVLIGRSLEPSRTVYQRAPVVNVQGPGAGTALPGATGPTGPTDAAGVAGAGGTSTGGTTSTAKSATTKQPSKPASKALSPAEKAKAAAATKAAQDKIKNAPKTTGTGGAAPKKDNKAPGGGSAAESIG